LGLVERSLFLCERVLKVGDLLVGRRLILGYELIFLLFGLSDEREIVGEPSGEFLFQVGCLAVERLFVIVDGLLLRRGVVGNELIVIALALREFIFERLRLLRERRIVLVGIILEVFVGPLVVGIQILTFALKRRLEVDDLLI